MTEWERAQAGYLYDANYDEEIVKARMKCADLCYEFNNCKPAKTQKQNELLHQILGAINGEIVVTAPFVNFCCAKIRIGYLYCFNWFV